MELLRNMIMSFKSDIITIKKKLISRKKIICQMAPHLYKNVIEKNYLSNRPTFI